MRYLVWSGSMSGPKPHNESNAFGDKSLISDLQVSSLTCSTRCTQLDGRVVRSSSEGRAPVIGQLQRKCDECFSEEGFEAER